MHNITIEINDSVRAHFNQVAAQSNHTLNPYTIEQVLQKIKQLTSTCQDESLINHLNDLNNMVQMLKEPHWHLTANKAKRINDTLAYFLNEQDLIPDSIPGVGYLDDCIVINNTKSELEHELDDFLNFKNTQQVYGKVKCLSQQDWRKIKKQETSSRLRHRRNKYASRKRHW